MAAGFFPFQSPFEVPLQQQRLLRKKIIYRAFPGKGGQVIGPPATNGKIFSILHCVEKDVARGNQVLIKCFCIFEHYISKNIRRTRQTKS